MNGMNKQALALLGLGHLMVDFNTGALPSLLPFLRHTFELSYTRTAVLMLVFSLASSFIQPAFGYLSDRSTRVWFLPMGILAATVGVAGIGLAPNYLVVLSLVLISGIGIASYHPEGYKAAYLSTGDKKATGVSIFSVGGNIGYGLGPIFITLCLAYFGQKGLLLLSVPGLMVGGFFLWSLSWLSRSGPPTTGSKQLVPLTRQDLIPLTAVLAVVTLGSWVHSGLVAFIPLYYDALGASTLGVGRLLSLFLISGAVGPLIGGPLSDRIGHRRFLVYALAPLCPLIMLFLRSHGLMSVGLLVVMGMCLSPMFAVSLVIAQGMMRERLGMTAGLMTGLGIGAGGLGVTLLGSVADYWGVNTTMQVISFLPLLPWGVALMLPIATPQLQEATA
jgi:FSR family fosmidomycin resistance protein-like MFS transporter